MLFSSLRPWRFVLAALALVLSASNAAGSATEALIESQSWRIDAAQKDSLAETQAATDWQPLSPWKSWGIGQEPIWVRLQLKAATSDNSMPWVVRIRPPYLDHVTLYDPASGLVLRTGDALPPSQYDVSSVNFTLQIPALPYERPLYLQMRNTGSRTMHVEVLPYGQAQQLNRLQEWLVGLVVVASAIFALWAAAQWWVTRDPVIGAFAFKQVLATGWVFFFMGFARLVIGPWLSEGVLTAMASTISPWVVGASLWFFAILMQGYQPARWAMLACKTLAGVTALLPLLQWFGLTHKMLVLHNLNVLLVFVLLITTLLSALPQRTQQPIPLPVLMGYLLVYATLNSLPPMMHLGWIEAHPIILFGNLTQAVLDGVIMFVMLQVRAHRLQKIQHAIALDLQQSRQQAETDKRHREEQGQLFAMLAHEMKTPLATLRMWMEAGQLKPATVERTITDMNSVIERCVHTGQLADQGLHAAPRVTDPAAVTQACIQHCRSPDRVDWAPPESDALLHTDTQMLSIALGNLLDNACKYSAPGSRIQVTTMPSTQDQRPGWSWQVVNTAGPTGLPDAERLFVKYYRSPQARRLSGSGLGLYLVKGLLGLMGGTISYEVHDKQAVFRIWVPDQATEC
jgi:two-component system, sensor histidine kinase LadS